jgi:hypothetical protein
MHYPLGMVWAEAMLARERRREAVALEAIMLHSVIAQAVGGGKVLEKFLKELRDG